MKRRLWVVCVVGLLAAVMVGPVLAAWAWTSADDCMWYRRLLVFPYSEEACDGTGAALILAGDGIEGEIDFTETGMLSVVGDCSTLTATVLDADFEPILEDEPIPVEISVVNGYFLVISNYGGSTCALTQISIGETEAEPNLLDGFTVTDLFIIASELINGFMSVIALIAGVYLGFKVLSWLISRIRG